MKNQMGTALLKKEKAAIFLLLALQFSNICSVLAVNDSQNVTVGIISFNDKKIDLITETTIKVQLKELSDNNFATIGLEACSFLDGVSSLILTEDCRPYCNMVVQIADQLAIPVFQTAPYLGLTESYSSIIDLSQKTWVENFLSNLIAHYEISSVVFIYDQAAGFEAALNLLEMGIKIIPLEIEDAENLKSLLIQIRDDYTDVKNLIVHTELKLVSEILEEALAVSLMNENYRWIITNLGTTSINWENYIYTKTKIVFISFDDELSAEITEWNDDLTSLQSMLVNESLSVIESAFELYIMSSNHSDIYNAENLILEGTCDESILLPKESSEKLLNVVKESFADIESKTMWIYEIKDEKLHKIGNVTENDGLINWCEQIDEELSLSFSTPLRVVTILSDPFTMYKTDFADRQGNDRFEGFLIEMIEEFAQIIEFSYELYLVPDGNYGAKDVNGTWNGLIKELLEDQADMALAPFTISAARESVVDFSSPYLFTGKNLLMRLGKSTRPTGFSFLEPLSYEVWICIAGSFLFLSLLLYLLNRFSPYELYQEKRKEKENLSEDQSAPQFDARNSLWFAYSAFVGQGVEVAPQAVSTKIVAGTWWLFVFVIVASYTANMTAFLTVERLETTIESPDDLVDQDQVSYGLLANGQTMSYLKGSKIEPFTSIWANIESSDPSWLVATTADGVQRACDENYAYIGDSVMNIYYANTYDSCDLITIGTPFAEGGFGLAYQTNSDYRDTFSEAILGLHESGKTAQFMQTWKLSESDTSDLSASVTDEGTVLGVKTLAGIFYILLGGCSLGVIVAFAECFWYRCKRSTASKTFHAKKTQNISQGAQNEAYDEFNSISNENKLKKCNI